MPSPADQSFGALLRRYRLARGLTQEELAERSGVSARAIGNMERGGTVRPYRPTVRSLADALDLVGQQRAELDRAARPAAGGEAAPAAGTDPGEMPGRTTAGAGTGQPDPASVPRQLPAAVSQFTGRAAELEALTGMLSEAGGTRTVVISALAGTAGVGKTAMAVHWAHQVAEHFRDGQLYVNLRGYDPDEPVTAAHALAGFLRALGVPGRQIPDGVEERSGLYRSRLAGRPVRGGVGNTPG